LDGHKNAVRVFFLFFLDLTHNFRYLKIFLKGARPMYAIIETGGKQIRVEPGDEISIEKIPGAPGDKITFDHVLAASDGEVLKVGKPFLQDSKVVGRLIRQGKGKKVIVFKYKRRKGYKRKKGHRQLFSLVKIEDIAI